MNRNKVKRKKGEFKMEAFEVIEKLESKGYKWQYYSDLKEANGRC
jgi:hypothetical protein